MAGFLGTANIIDGVVENGGFEMGGALRLPVPGGAGAAGARLVFRPQHASLAAAGARRGRGHREFLGATVRYGVRVVDIVVIMDAPFQTGGLDLHARGRTRSALPCRLRRALYLGSLSDGCQSEASSPPPTSAQRGKARWKSG